MFEQESDKSRVLIWKGLRCLHLMILEELDIKLPWNSGLKFHLFSINGFRWIQGDSGTEVPRCPSAYELGLRTASLASLVPRIWPTCSVFCALAPGLNIELTRAPPQRPGPLDQWLGSTKATAGL